MAPTRSLPSKRNPLMSDNIPDHSDLIARRRLGQTKLTARMVAAAPGDDIDPASLCAFDYAHLRAPLPQGIVSGIFVKPSPGSYFLMRRSSDGYVSASGMFKAAFPYAEAEEEELERQHIKSLEPRSHDETAGNIWISPEHAVILGEDYGVLPWIRALLDPSEIQPGAGTESSPPKKITSPPQFFIGASHPNLAYPTPTSIPRSSRSRRSASPTKIPSKRSIASPRKSRVAKITSSQSSVDEPQETKKKSSKLSAPTATVNGDAAAASLPTPQSSTIVETFEKEPNVVLEPVEEEPKIKVHVEQDVKIEDDGKEVTHTSVEIEMPLLGEGPDPKETERMIAEAKAMVKEAAENKALSSPSSSNAKGKRKADEVAVDEEDKENESALDQPRSKKVKTEVELKKERVRNRALLGISATLAVGALVPYVMGML